MEINGVVPSFNILVVDDFPDFRRFVCSVLKQRAEFSVSEASDGLQAVEKAKELKPDLILLDLALPALNGIEVARRVRNLVPAARILFVSLESSQETVREALRLGAGYVHKVSLSSDLLPAIEAVLGGKRFLSSSLELSGGADLEAPSTHEIVFCADEAALLGGLTHFIATALNAGSPALVLATESHQQRLLQRLRFRGMDINAAIERGTYFTVDADREPSPEGFIETIQGLREAASQAGNERARVAIFGERAGRLWAAGKTEEAIRFEQFGHELAKSQGLDILCAYPSPGGRKEEPALKSICAIHSAVRSR